MDILAAAKECGFDDAGFLKIETLKPMQMVRDYCSADKCGAYDKNWTCPPRCGTIEECEEKMHSYTHGVLLQSVGMSEKRIDAKMYGETALRHNQSLMKLADVLREEYGDILCLGAGGCTVCKKCAFPEPCRFPDKKQYSLEGFGLFVTQVCKDNDLPYYRGPKSITYSAAILYNEK